MCFVDRPLLDLVGHPEISAITDLKGKLVGLSSRGGLHDVTMRRIFVQSGMDPSQATFITLGEQGAMMTAIKSGKIAAGLLNPPHNFLGLPRWAQEFRLRREFFPRAQHGPGDHARDHRAVPRSNQPRHPGSYPGENLCQGKQTGDDYNHAALSKIER